MHLGFCLSRSKDTPWPWPQGMELLAPGLGWSGSSPPFLPAASELPVTSGPWSWCLGGTRSIPGRRAPLPHPGGGGDTGARARTSPFLRSWTEAIGADQGRPLALAPRTPLCAEICHLLGLRPQGRSRGAQQEFPSPEFPVWPPPLGPKWHLRTRTLSLRLSDPPLPYLRLPPGAHPPRPPKCPLLQTSRGAVEKAGARAARGVPAASSRETNRSAQTGSSRS